MTQRRQQQQESRSNSNKRNIDAVPPAKAATMNKSTRKITLEVPEGLYKVLTIEAVLFNMTIEEAAISCIKDQIESKRDMPELYNSEMEQIYRGKKLIEAQATRTA